MVDAVSAETAETVVEGACSETMSTADGAEVSDKPSKRSLKKAIKREQWKEKVKVKRLKEREKCKEKKRQEQLSGEIIKRGPSRKELKRNKVDEANCAIKIAIDLNFNEFMSDKDTCKCVKQLLRVYTINRRSKSPACLHFTGFKEGSHIHQTLERNDGYKNWDVKMNPLALLEVFSKDELIYLTSDSPNTLTELDKDKIYVIGGLVDHNQHKGLCFNFAETNGLKHARLPLNENIIMKTRAVLSIDHVFEILLRIVEGLSWQEALLNVLPQRKGAAPIIEACSSDAIKDTEDMEPSTKIVETE